MDLNFLSATKPITKSYALNNGQLEKTSYPFVYEVTSHQETAKDLPAMAALLSKYAKKGACLLKGNLGRPLVSESRKGSTDANAKTNWICLDLDGVDNYTDVDNFLDDIGAGNTDYVLQWSSSMGIENKVGLRCHVFMTLDKEHHPQLLKHWLMTLNLSRPVLAAQLELTKTGNSLRWSLDVTTCQNDKLLYIAAPILGPGLADPYPPPKRIVFVKKRKPTLSIITPILTRDQLREMTDKQLSILRQANGLPKRRATKYKYAGTTEYMVSPDSAVITETKTERGFVYFNLNGGDSWAYYHPEDQPQLIFNFKGEPPYLTKDLLPEYWAGLQQDANSFTANSKGKIYLAFRDFRSSDYFNGTYDASINQLILAKAKSESQLRQFMGQHGQMLGDCIPDWNLVWNPSDPTVVDVKAQTVNTYQPSPLLPVPSKVVPLTIKKVIEHALGNDPAAITHFLNWLAVIVQFRTMTGTAWILHGTQGTGKGVLFHQIITPLLGFDNCTSKRMEELESEFTGFMENKLCVLIDEIESGRSLHHAKITAKLKNLITEPSISIRRMYSPAFLSKNHSSMIFASNKPKPVEIEASDRRFNVGGFQTTPIQLTGNEILIDIPTELPKFLGFLTQYPANQNLARQALNNAAKDKLVDINRTALDTVLDALRTGNMEFFWDHLSSTKGENLPSLLAMKYTPYRDLVLKIVETKDTKLTRDELLTLCEWCVGGMPTSPNKFTTLLKHHDMPTIQVWKYGRNVKGIEVVWKPDPVWHIQATTDIRNQSV